MKRAFLPASAATIAFVLALRPAIAADPSWPPRLFAPYMFLGAGDDFKLTDGADACGLKHYTLAFVIARQDGRGPDTKYYPEPAWYGRVPVAQGLYVEQINAIRQRGGDVFVSFGGEAGRELAIVEENVGALQAEYQAVIDRYHFTWLDFDIEGANLDQHASASRRRNTALAALQTANPGLRVSFTLPVDPDGLSDASRALLSDAKAKGVRVHSADLMVMYFGDKFTNKGKSEGELGIESAKAAYAQIQKIDPSIAVGLCPCLGRNGSGKEVFTVEDARTLKAFADATPWVCSLHYWSVNGDATGLRRKRRSGSANTNAVPAALDLPQPWAFANIFKSFTTSP